MAYVNEDECEAAGLDCKKVLSLARRFERGEYVSLTANQGEQE